MSIARDKPILTLCEPVAEVIYMNVDLLREGFTPFQYDCEDQPHGNTSAKKKKYLRKEISTNAPGTLTAKQENCNSNGGGKSDIWRLERDSPTLRLKIDPFTGLSENDGDVGFISPNIGIEGGNCVHDTITRREVQFSDSVTKCDGSIGSKYVTIQFDDENNDEKLGANASSVLNHFSLFNTTEIPQYDTFVDIVPGTDGLQNRSGANVSSMPKDLAWRAKHFVNDSGISKSRLFIKFTVQTVYTEATGSYEDDGSVSEDYNPLVQGTVKTASAGSIITIDPPEEKNTFIEIHACQHLTVCSKPDCSISVKETEANVSQKFIPEQDCSSCTDFCSSGGRRYGGDNCPCSCTWTDGGRFEDPFGKRYAKLTSYTSRSVTSNVTFTPTGSSGHENSSGGCSDSTGPPDYIPIDNYDNDDLQILDITSGSATLSGTDSSAYTDVLLSCDTSPSREYDDPSEMSYSGSVTTQETFTSRNCPEDGPREEDVSTVSYTETISSDPDDIPDFNTDPYSVSLSVSNFQPVGISGSKICLPDDKAEVSTSFSSTIWQHDHSSGSDSAEGAVDEIEIYHEISTSNTSVSISSEFSGSVTADTADVFIEVDPLGTDRFEKVTASGSVEGLAINRKTLSDPVQALGNYTGIRIPNQDDDGVRDGALTESIRYSGDSRTHVNVKSVTFKVDTYANSKKSIKHRTYLNFLISELDTSNPDKSILSHRTITDFLDERCNTPSSESDQWTVEKKLPISISLPDSDGSSAVVTSITCFTSVDLNSEEGCS